MKTTYSITTGRPVISLNKEDLSQRFAGIPISDVDLFSFRSDVLTMEDINMAESIVFTEGRRRKCLKRRSGTRSRNRAENNYFRVYTEPITREALLQEMSSLVIEKVEDKYSEDVVKKPKIRFIRIETSK